MALVTLGKAASRSARGRATTSETSWLGLITSTWGREGLRGRKKKERGGGLDCMTFNITMHVITSPVHITLQERKTRQNYSSTHTK